LTKSLGVNNDNSLANQFYREYVGDFNRWYCMGKQVDCF
jgi:hypothetical protein